MELLEIAIMKYKRKCVGPDIEGEWNRVWHCLVKLQNIDIDCELKNVFFS